MKKILFDSDVIIDVLMQRQPYLEKSIQALDTANDPNRQAYIAAHAITNIFYIIRRQIGTIEALAAIEHLLQKTEIARVDDLIIRTALKTKTKDFEDAVTMATAKAVGVEIIITRNIKDYVNSPVPAVSPQTFLTMK